MRRTLMLMALAGVFVWCAFPLSAEGDDVPAREAAVDRYLEVFPVSEALGTVFDSMLDQFPTEKRDEVAVMCEAIANSPKVTELMRDGMVQVFTTEEIDALADFYGSEIGQSAMKKQGELMTLVLPKLREMMPDILRDHSSSK